MDIKNKRISLLTMAVLLSTVASSFGSSNNGYNPASLPFSAQSAFAQVSGEAKISTDNDNSTIDLNRMTQQDTNSRGFGSGTIFNGNQDNKGGGTGGAESPFNFEGGLPTNAEDQQPSLASRSSTTDFRSFLDSFANSIFNGTSAFGALGTSIVNGVNVIGISLDKNQNQLSITLGKTTTAIASPKNITGNESIRMPRTITTADARSVSVIAMRIPINMDDILSLVAASSSSSLSSSNSNILDDVVQSPGEVLPPKNPDPFSLLSNLQIGSTVLTDVNWSEPQMVTMSLVGNSEQLKEQQILSSSDLPMTDIVFVSVIPYTGLTGLTGNNTESRAITSR
jgi:hypothetical protein